MKYLLIDEFFAPKAFKIPIIFILSSIKTKRTDIILIDATSVIMKSIATIFLSNNFIHSKIE